MAKFQYRLQSVLNLKEKFEKQAKMEFSIAQAHLNDENDKLNTLRGRLQTYVQQAVVLRSAKLDLLKLKENQMAQERIEEYIKEQKIQIKIAEEALEKARIKLQETRMDRKMHEKLRESAFENFRQEENRREYKEVDELTSYKYGRKKQKDHTAGEQ